MLETEEVKVGSTDVPNLVKKCLQMQMKLYIDDKCVANQVRSSILGLKWGKKLACHDIKVSPVFQLCGSKQEDKKLKNISEHWISHLADLKALGEAPLEEHTPLPGWTPVYTWEGLK